MKKKEKKKEPTGLTVLPTAMTYDRPTDGDHCSCGGYMWAIHDEDGLIIYYKCGDCGAKR